MDYRAYTEMYYNTICHHGVKGQKWGKRRYQNEDGSLTQEGRERYLTLNLRGRFKYGVPNSVTMAKIGGTVTAAAAIHSVANKKMYQYTKRGNVILSKQYGISSTSLNKKLNTISSSNLKKSKKSAKIAIAAAGITSIAVLTNEIRRKKIMKRLNGMDQDDKGGK